MVSKHERTSNFAKYSGSLWCPDSLSWARNCCKRGNMSSAENSEEPSLCGETDYESVSFHGIRTVKITTNLFVIQHTERRSQNRVNTPG